MIKTTSPRALELWGKIDTPTPNLEELASLLQKEVYRTSINATFSDSKTLLHLAAMRAHKLIMLLLLELGANPNMQDSRGKTPLFYVCKYVDESTLIFFSNKKASFTIKTHDHFTLMHQSAKEGNVVAINFLHSKNLSVKDPGRGNYTPLHFAACEGHLLAVKRLIELGAVVDVADEEEGKKATPFLYAISKNKNFVALELLKQGANLFATDASGKNAFHFSILNKNISLFMDLMNEIGSEDEEKYAKLREVALDHNGNNFIHYCAMFNVLGFIPFLSNLCRIDPYQVNKNNKTPLQLAQEKGHPHIIAEINTLNKKK